MIMETVCPDCHGSGRKVTDKCPDCNGNGYIKYKKELKIKIPAGIDDGTRIRVTGEGAAGIPRFELPAGRVPMAGGKEPSERR